MNSHNIVKIWRSIKVGTGLKTIGDFTKALKKKDCKINGSSESLLARLDLTTGRDEQQIDLVVVSVDDLGFKKGATALNIYRRAKKRGLNLCPSEVGPQLRLQYEDQPEGGWLLIGMEPIMGDGTDRHIFGVSSDFYGSKDLFTKIFEGSFFQADARWVFAHGNVNRS